MRRTLRAALTETCNAYPHMPASVSGLSELSDRMDEIRAANVNHHRALIAKAAALDVQLICLGELFTGPYFALERDPMWHDLAEDATNGPTVTSLQAEARDRSMIVVAPIYERDAASGKRFNTAVIVDERGDVIGKYRKVHIPSGANEQAGFHETFYYDPSDGELGEWSRNISDNPFFPVFETSVVRLGVAICYDRHFPGVMRALATNGAELVVCPAVTFGAKSQDLWELEFPVDAARHNVFIGGSNRRGVEAPWEREYFGRSYFVGPNGRVPKIDASAELVVVDLDLEELDRPDPSGWDLSRDQRPEIYNS